VEVAVSWRLRLLYAVFASSQSLTTEKNSWAFLASDRLTGVTGRSICCRGGKEPKRSNATQSSALWRPR